MGDRSKQAIRLAYKRNADMDAADRQNGFATPADRPESIIPTAMAALEAGIEIEDWGCVADAYVLLEILLKQQGAMS